jgi:hypothetical protein
VPVKKLQREESPSISAERTDASRKLPRFKGDLVLQLFAKSGPFWDAIRDLRDRYDITPSTELPPASSDILPPHSNRESSSVIWQGEILLLCDQFVPKRFLYRMPEWLIFISACVVYDPPETQLPEFAAYSDPLPFPIVSEERWSDPNFDKLPKIEAPPIEMVPDLDEIEALEQWFHRMVLNGLEKRLKSFGISSGQFREIYDDVLDEGLWSEYHTRYLQIKAHPYIEIDEHTTKKDVERTFNAIRATQASGPPARKRPRDPVIAVDCAILHDDYGWKYEELAERHGWQDSSRASKYIRDGRKVRVSLGR